VRASTISRGLLGLAATLLIAQAAFADPKPDLTDPFPYEPGPFEASMERERRLPGMTVYRVEMPSPVDTGNATNDKIYGHYYKPWRRTDACAIVLPIAAGRDLTLEQSFAGYLALRGVRAFVMPLPYQHGRNDGTARNVLGRHGSFETLNGFFRQGVLDTKRVREWLTREEGVSAERVGLVGISLGSFVAAVAYATDPGFSAAACLLGGGDLAQVIWHDSGETRRIKHSLVEAGYDLDDARAALRQIDPLSWASPERGSGMLMINATDDEVVPRDCTWKLRQAWGEPEFMSFPGNHYSVAVFLPVALESTARHMRSRLLGE
jgi:dienelactone hydrolase